MTAVVIYRDFWCELCRRWTSPEPGVVPAKCSTCWECYFCGECGFEIDLQGNCLRAEAGPAEDVGRCPSTTTTVRRFGLFKDGVQQGEPLATSLDALGELHKRVGYSAAHAMKHEGWEIRPVDVEA